MDSSHRRRLDFNAQSTNVAAQRGATTGRQGLQGNVRKPRHAGLFQAIHRFDMQMDQAAKAELAKWIRDEYEREIGDIPLGFVAKCYLGPPFVDHRLDLFDTIVEHYAPSDVMPEPYAQARMLVRTGAYEYVEIYASGTIRPVLADGSVVA